MEGRLTSCQDRIPEEEPDTDRQGIFSLIVTIWKSQSCEKCQAANHLKDLMIFFLTQFDRMKLFKRTSFHPKLLFYHFHIFSKLCHFIIAELFLTFQSVLLHKLLQSHFCRAEIAEG